MDIARDQGGVPVVGTSANGADVAVPRGRDAGAVCPSTATVHNRMSVLGRSPRPGCPSSSEEVLMNKWVRQAHRWFAVAFTVTVVATVIALAQREPVVWVSYLPLLPLALLFFSGLYLFVLPYAARWRSARRAAPEG